MNYFTRKVRVLGISVFAVAVLLAVSASPAMADWSQRQKITSTPRGVGAQFANEVAISGNTMIVGARFDSTTASQAGAAYVYVLNGSTWTQQAVLLAPDGAAGDKFGSSVAILGDTIVVGAYNDDAAFSNSGSAYVFVRSGTTWTFEQKLTASDGTADDEFGNAVAVAGLTIAVGAHFADLPGNAQAGSVYLFRRDATAWAQFQKLVPVAPVVLGDHFGESLAYAYAITGLLAIGASGDDTPETSAGAVYVFYDTEGLGFELSQKLTIPDGTNGDRFGSSVAIEGNTLVGGAREDGPAVGQTAYGAAYAFKFNGTTWDPQGKLVASDGASFDRFGWSVGVSGNVIAVGAREDDTGAGPDAGSAYIFERNGSTWTETQKLTPGDPFNGDRFGSGVALRDGNLVIGAAEKALSNPNGQGAVYYFTSLDGTLFDIEGDGKSDLSIYRPSNGQWWHQRSSDNGVGATTFGISTDKIAPADYDGDGKSDIAVYRPSTGIWFILNSASFTVTYNTFGLSADVPTPADYDGDGSADVSVFRPSDGTWYRQNSGDATYSAVAWGTSGDKPVLGDFDGDGKADFVIYRAGTWWLNRSTDGITAIQFGVGTDKPVPADYTGDGKTDIAVWRPDTGAWYVLRSEDFSFYAELFGSNGDIPVPGDYDGEGRSDIAVFRPAGSNWFIQRSTQGILIQNFGTTGDIPLESAYIP